MGEWATFMNREEYEVRGERFKLNWAKRVILRNKAIQILKCREKLDFRIFLAYVKMRQKEHMGF